MSEWLTTGEMIDRLKVGEVAESEVNSKLVSRVKRFNDGIYFIGHDGKKACFEEGKYFPLNIGHDDILKRKWHILPKYVTFEEAMKALKNDKEVWFHRENGKPFIFKANDYFTFRIENLPFSFFTMHELFEGKWQIIE